MKAILDRLSRLEDESFPERTGWLMIFDDNPRPWPRRFGELRVDRRGPWLGVVIPEGADLARGGWELDLPPGVDVARLKILQVYRGMGPPGGAALFLGGVRMGAMKLLPGGPLAQRLADIERAAAFQEPHR